MRIDEAAEIKDQAAALQAYARQREDPERERWMAEIKVRAVRRMGELLQELDTSKDGANPAATLPAGGKSKSKAIADAGLSKSTAHRYEELAGPREERAQQVGQAAAERYFTEARVNGEPGLRCAAGCHSLADLVGAGDGIAIQQCSRPEARRDLTAFPVHWIRSPPSMALKSWN